MIISASRRTDIPAFYSKWFMNRIREGYFYRINPFNSKQVSGFSLKPEDVDTICFWTKNPQPLLQNLDELDRRGHRYYFQFTLNPYCKIFEPHLPPLKERIATFRELARRIGPERVVWRYDPVILSSVTPIAWHIEQAELIASQLKDATRRLIFSFYDFYGRRKGRLHAALTGSGIALKDITAPDKTSELGELVSGFKAIADRLTLQILSCSEEIDLSGVGVEHGACIDGKLIHELFGTNPSSSRDRNQREACNCIESADMGIYNTCRFRCAYCYANFNEAIIERNCRKHNPDSPVLTGCHEKRLDIRTSLHKNS